MQRVARPDQTKRSEDGSGTCVKPKESMERVELDPQVPAFTRDSVWAWVPQNWVVVDALV